MRPYLALIKDSFRAAIASNVLYVLLGVITLLLLTVAPLHVREVLDWQLKFGANVSEPDTLAKQLVERGEDSDHPKVNRVWERLSDELKKDLRTMVEFQQDESTMPDSNKRVMHELNTRSELQKQLNGIIKSRDFYQEGAWASKRLNPEAKDLLASGFDSLTDERMKRLNRLLMASTFVGIVDRGGGNALELWYGRWFWEVLAYSNYSGAKMSYNDFAKITLGTVTWVFDKFVLSIGLFIAILVTANFIPETFLPGSLNLLLSKPVTRWGVLIAKFIGGCVFASLCAAYLFLGLWLWLGFGMGIWDPGILWGIPLYIVVFAIYYSVSTLVGVWSRSAILSIIVTAVFWGVCFAVGLTHQLTGGRIDNSRTRDLITAKDKLLQVGELSAIYLWDEDGNQWDRKLEIKMADAQRIAMGGVMFVPGAGDDNDLSSIGPIYDPKQDQILVGMIDLSNPSTMNFKNLYVSSAESTEFEEFGKVPRNTQQFFADPDGVIAVLSNGEFKRYVGTNSLQAIATEGAAANESEVVSVQKDSSKTENGTSEPDDPIDTSTAKKTVAKDAELFVDIGPEDGRVGIAGRHNVTFNPTNRNILIFSNGTITRFSLNDEGRYVRAAERSLETGVRADMPGIIGAGGETVVVALGNGRIFALDAESLEERQSWLPQQESPFRMVEASRDGRYFIFYCRNRSAWMLDTQNPEEIVQPSAFDQGSITAVRFDDQNRLWISARDNQAQLIELDSMKRIESVAPSIGRAAWVFNYLVDPIYRGFPKPGEFYRIVSYLSAAPDVQETDVDLSSLSDAKNPWQPLWSGLLFMGATLFVACLIFQYSDF